MTATQAPTPGPLTAESVKLLVKGDLLMLDGQPVRFLNLFMGGIRADDGSDKRISALPPDRFAFIGRPDESGWMPWSGSENPFGQTIVSVRLATGAEVTKRADHFPKVAWSNIITHALAPTAPVEASGSDWKQAASGKRLVANLASYCGGETPGCTDISPCCDCLKQANVFERGADPFGAYVTHLGDLLRPQPSGETRSILTRDQIINALNDHIDAELAGPTETRAEATGIEEAADAILALLSARPLALGGQHSTATDFPPDDVLACVNDTTPARAEAQDEGAAGYLVALLASYCGDDTSGCTGETPCLDCVRMANVYKIPKTALGEFVGELGNIAASSPTPAADADRVRIAVEALEKADAAARSGAAMSAADYSISAERLGEEIYKITTPALAALKSTAAKEGGEG